MNRLLQNVFEITVDILKEDKECIGGWHFGSISRGMQDEYSDIDPVFLIEDEGFEEFAHKIPGIFKQVGYEVLLMWPEEFNSSYIKNYAILIQEKENIVQYDFTIMKHSDVYQPFSRIWYQGCDHNDIIFDKYGHVKRLLGGESQESDLQIDIAHMTQKYWLYCYIIVKYLKRKDLFKLLYTMNELFHTHLTLLSSIYVEEDWGSWADQIKNNISPDKQKELLNYFCTGNIQCIERNLINCISSFEKDARRACIIKELSYDENLATKIKRYIDQNVYNR